MSVGLPARMTLPTGGTRAPVTAACRTPCVLKAVPPCACLPPMCSAAEMAAIICSMHWNSAGASRWRCRNPRWGHSNFMTMCITRMEPCWARKKGTLSSMTPAFLWTIMVGYILSAVSAPFQASTPSLLPCIWLQRAASSLNWQTICVPCAKPHRSFCPSRRMLRGPNLRSTRFLKHRPCAKRMAVII